MTISSTTNRVSYAGNGVTTAFSFPYYFLADGDLTVILVVDATHVETTKTLTTHYTVSGAANPAGGTVTMLTAPAAGETLVILRDPAVTQSVDLVENDPLPVNTAVEQPLDRLTMIAQRLKDLVTRAFRLSDGDTSGASLTIAPEASKFLAWNSTGTALINATPSSTTIAVTTFIATLLDDTTAVGARATLGALATDFTSLTAETLPAADDVLILRDTSAGTTDKITLANLFAVIPNLTAEASPAVGDTIPVYDLSEAAANSMALSDVLKVVNELTEDTSPNLANDFLVTYDASASAAKKVKLGGPSRFGIIKFGGVDVTQNATTFLQAIGKTVAATEGDTQYVLPAPADVSQLRVVLSAAVPASQTATLTLRRNGADTAVTVTLTAGQTTGSDVVNTASYDEGDLLAIKVVTSATFTSVIDFGVTVITNIKGSNAGLNMGLVWGAANTTNVYSANDPNTAAPSVATEARAEVPLPAGFIRKFVLSLWATGGVMKVDRNAAAVTANLTTAAYPAATGWDSQAVYFAANDLYNVRNSDGGTTGSLRGYSEFSDTLWGFNRTMFTLMSATDQAQATTRYMGGYACSAQSATETDVQLPMPACTIKNLRVASSAALPGGQTCIVTVRKNGVDTAVTATLTSASRLITDLTNSVAFAAGDKLTISSVSSATAGTLSYNVCFEIEP